MVWVGNQQIITTGWRVRGRRWPFGFAKTRTATFRPLLDSELSCLLDT